MRLTRPYARSRPLAVREVELQGPGAGEILVAIRAAGLCHSDLSVIDGSRARPMPMVLGHEAAGVVEEVGPEVRGLSVGDHVVTTFVPSCRECSYCVAGRPALCEPGASSNLAGALLSGARRLGDARGPIHHHLGVSAFAQYSVLCEHSLVRVDRALPFDQAAVFGCAVLTGVGALANTVNMPPGARVAIVGLGGVGLAAVLGARAMQASLIVAVDLSKRKLALAQELGADLCFEATEPDCVEKIRQATRGGVDYALEVAGSARALKLAYEITRRGGTTLALGLPSPQEQLSVAPVTLVAEERSIKGSYFGSCDPQRDVPRFIEWFYAGRLPVDRLISAHVAMEDLNEAFDALADGTTIRQIMVN
jgi:alcohol dehydrogenase